MNAPGVPVEIRIATAPLVPVCLDGPGHTATDDGHSRKDACEKCDAWRKEPTVAVRPWLRRLRDNLSSTNTRRRQGRRRQRSGMQSHELTSVIDKLEDRTLLAATVQFGLGTLQILSDAGEDIAIQEDPTTLPIDVLVFVDGSLVQNFPGLPAADVTSIVIATGSGDNVIDLSGVSGTAFTNLTDIAVATGNGDDIVTGSPDFPHFIDGGDGEDLLIGGNVADSLMGGDGNDTLQGGDGNDTLEGGDGDDSLQGGLADDSVAGDDGHDTLDGGDGNDVIFGGDGHDNITGGDGDDTANGNGGRDLVTGTGRGTRTLTSAPGNQTVTFEVALATTDTISLSFINSVPNSGTSVATVNGVGQGAAVIQIELGDDGMMNTATGSDIAAAVAASPEASSVLNVVVTGPDEAFSTATLAALTFTSAGSNNDSLLGGGGNDLVIGAEGNDTLLGNGGNDTLMGNDGNDTLGGHGGNDSILGGAGQDSLDGAAGADTLEGDAGGDTILGGGGNDLAIGDSSDVFTTATGNDLIRGQGGDDTVVGVFGADTLEGGTGDDVLRSTLAAANIVPPAPNPPPPPPFVATGVIQPLGPAIPSGGATTLLTNPATLTNGTGDGDLNIGGIDAAGDFGFGFEAFDPISPTSPAAFGIISNSDIYLRIGSGGQRTQLTSGNTISGNATELLSNFTSNGLDFGLVQTVTSLNDFDGVRAGSQLTQTYTITNTTPSALTFELVRYNEANMFNFVGPNNDGGGVFQDPNGVDIFFESTGIVTAGGAATFIGITGIGGDSVSANRFEFGPAGSTLGTIQSGAALSDSFNSFFGPADTDGDGFVDQPNFDSEVAVRNVFTLAAGATTEYTTHTLFGTLQLLGTNLPPVGTADTAVTFGGNPITIDVVSNDSDSDGTLDFSSVTIVGQPSSGTAVSLGDGRITYTPDPQFPGGPVSFTYTIDDNGGATSGETIVTVDVIAADIVGDVIDGSIGNDIVFGSEGADLITTGSGNDRINAGDGNDTVRGGSGDDVINGEEGDDSLVGQGGDDTLDGGTGQDTLRWDGLGDGKDVVFGGEGADTAFVQTSAGPNTVSVSQDILGRLIVREGTATFTIDNASINQTIVNSGAGNDSVTITDLHFIGSMRVVVDGNVGDDVIEARGAMLGRVRLEIFGGAGNDTLGGGRGRDRIFGGDGDDVIRGRSGADTIFGNTGADLIFGGAANDSINGGTDDDTIFGNNGDDRLDGGEDSDDVDGGVGDDTLLGGLGDDQLNGMEGDDSLLGGDGIDMMFGGSGRDTLDGGRNNDTMFGNSGDDTLLGNHGDDSIMGEEGDDEIVGGDGNDTIFAGDGDDGVAGNDGNDVLDGGLGNDTMRGDDGDDTLRGGGGADTLVGDQGVDVLNGNGGNDLGVTGEGADPTPIRIEIIDESFVLTSRMLQSLDGI